MSGISSKIAAIRARFWLGTIGAVALLFACAVFLPWPHALAAALAPRGGRLERLVDPVVLDRAGRVLFHGPGNDGRRGEWRALDAIPPRLIQAFLAAEDARFFTHHGFDPWAIARAFADDCIHRRIVSGASTITQQTVRLMQPARRTVLNKAVEIVRALAVEKLWTKTQILEQYLNRVPMPGNRRGVVEGARYVFDRDLAGLSIGECAVLASFPQTPTRLDPYRPRAMPGAGGLPARLERRRRWILARMLLAGALTQSQYSSALTQVPRLARPAPVLLAGHRVAALVAAEKRRAADREDGPHRLPWPVRTTIDRDVQRLAQDALASHGPRLRAHGCRQAACVVLDTRTREVLAWVGSLAYGERDLGCNDGVLARRSAGSTLKPFAYALALERGFSLASVLPDVRRTFATPHGDYDPRDFDRQEHGPVLLRTALAASLNAAAVDLARRIGPKAIADTLAQLSLLDPHGDPRDLGVGIVIGNVEVRLIDLAAAYATLACGGEYSSARWIASDKRPSVLRLFPPDVAYLVLDALQDPAARLLTMGNPLCFDFSFPVALKTGTSTGYRDTWAVGVTPRWTVAVWTGNFSGGPTAGLAGATGAAPILHDVLVGLEQGRPPLSFPRPPGLVERSVCSDSGLTPTPACPSRLTELFLAHDPAPPPCRFHHDAAGARTELGPTYAAWLADRTLRGLSGRYRLAGAAGTRRLPAAPNSGGGTRHRSGLGWVDSGQGAGLEIVEPHAGDRFVIPLCRDVGEHPRVVRVRAIPHGACDSIRWFLDGEEQARTPAPYRWDWTLTPGRHRILATMPDLTGATEISVTVE